MEETEAAMIEIEIGNVETVTGLDCLHHRHHQREIEWHITWNRNNGARAVNRRAAARNAELCFVTIVTIVAVLGINHGFQIGRDLLLSHLQTRDDFVLEKGDEM